MLVETKDNLEATPTEVQKFALDDEELIELLVDDELDEEERVSLLARLDEIPNGWRICARSFLEAQTFRSALRNYNGTEQQQTPLVNPPRIASKLSPREGSVQTRRTQIFVVLATVVLICCFALFKGFDFTQNDRSNKIVSDLPSSNNQKTASIEANVSEPEITFNSLSASAPSPPNSPAGMPGAGMTGSGMLGSGFAMNTDGTDNVMKKRAKVLAESSLNEFGQGAQNLALGGSSDKLLKGSSPIRTVTLNCPAYGLNNVSASCVENERFDPSVLVNANKELPQELLEQLQNHGGRVQARRDQYRFSLDDGRVLILPVDTYDVKYDSNTQIW